MGSRRLKVIAIAVLVLGAFAGAWLVVANSGQNREAACFADEAGFSKPTTLAGIKKFQKVDDDLYRGAQPDARGLRALEKMGIRMVVNLRKGHSDRRMLKGTSLAYKNIGMNVWHAEDEDVVAFLKLVKDKSKGPFFVHCQHGVDRTGFMCAIYRIVMQGWGKEKALREMKAFGTHEVWRNLDAYIRNLDVGKMRQAVGL